MEPQLPQLPQLSQELWIAMKYNDRAAARAALDVDAAIAAAVAAIIPVPGAANITYITPPLAGFSDPRGVVGDRCYDPGLLKMHEKVSISPHTWIQYDVANT